jgi:hypothetical protein
MDSYLELARQVLKASRRPMTAKKMLDAAYRAGIVPSHLFGRTQEKTLQARLSEDILEHRDTSLFFRTEPGVFFLSELIPDPEVPDKFKERFPARRRTRDLLTEPFLAIDADFVRDLGRNLPKEWSSLVRTAEDRGAIHYFEANGKPAAALAVWTFSLVRRGNLVLSYRSGRYREDRDSFANRRTIGFPGVVRFSDYTLFSNGDYGASENSLAAISSDLDISPTVFHTESIEPPRPISAFIVDREPGQSVLMIVMDWTCPRWFEPTTRRLSLNDPLWMDATLPLNNVDDFEPWSVSALGAVRETLDEQT